MYIDSFQILMLTISVQVLLTGTLDQVLNAFDIITEVGEYHCPHIILIKIS